jgi:hypothetical protein
MERFSGRSTSKAFVNGLLSRLLMVRLTLRFILRLGLSGIGCLGRAISKKYLSTTSLNPVSHCLHFLQLSHAVNSKRLRRRAIQLIKSNWQLLLSQ